MLQGLTPTIAESRGTFLEFFLGISYNRWGQVAHPCTVFYCHPSHRPSLVHCTIFRSPAHPVWTVGTNVRLTNEGGRWSAGSRMPGTMMLACACM